MHASMFPTYILTLVHVCALTSLHASAIMGRNLCICLCLRVDMLHKLPCLHIYAFRLVRICMLIGFSMLVCLRVYVSILVHVAR